jgi:peptide/nickel transport system substrate-binding protein
MKTWREGEKLVLRKNQNYFETDKNGQRLPYLEAVTIKFISDKQSEFLEFSKGEIDFISGVHNSYKDELLTRSGTLRQKYKSYIVLSKAPYLNTEYLGFLTDSSLSPVSNRNLRKAINWGFDRKKMLNYLRNNIGTPANKGFVPKGLATFNLQNDFYSYNTDSALFYLDKAGFNQEHKCPKIQLTTTSDYVDLCEYIQHQLSEIGIDIKIEISSGATFRDQVSGSKLEFFRGSWIADYPDAENYLSLFYSPNFSPNGPNYTHFSNPTFDQLYEQSLIVSSDSLRQIIYKQMDSLITTEAAVVPLFYDEVIRFYQSNLRNFETNAMNMLFLKTVYKE